MRTAHPNPKTLNPVPFLHPKIPCTFISIQLFYLSRGQPLDLLKRFKEEVSRFDISGRTVRIALSGGADSIALAELLIRTKTDYDIAALHIIHGIREGGNADAEFVREYCRDRKIPLEIIQVDTPRFAEEQHIGIEEAGRELRYRIFSEFTSKGEIVATGHTAGDVVETLLFNLLRGSGPRGLAGIPRERDGIIRPLLPFWRPELERWLKAQNQKWREDESNRDLRFSRNRIRWMLIPEIKRVFGEGAPDRLRREADIFSACAEFIEKQGAQLAEKSLVTRFANILAFDSENALSTLWGFGEILRYGFEELGEGLSGFSFESVERLWENIKSARRGRRFPAGEGLHIEADTDLLFIFREIPEHSAQSLKKDSEIEFPNGLGDMIVSTEGDGEIVPYDGGELVLRIPKPGDRIDPEHKLNRYLARNNVPRLLRNAVPVLFSGERPIYSPLVGALMSEPALFELYIETKGAISKIAGFINKEKSGKLRD